MPCKRTIIFYMGASIETDKSFKELKQKEFMNAMYKRIKTMDSLDGTEPFEYVDETTKGETNDSI